MSNMPHILTGRIPRAFVICALLSMGLGLSPVFESLTPKAEANAKVKRATRYYLKGMKKYRSRRYNSAIGAFRRAARILPRHPHFNCHRTRFYTYIGRSYERKRSPRGAMSAYRKARRSGCSKASGYARRRYRILYRRWMTSIRIYTRPKKARVYLVMRRKDKYIGKTPLKRVFKPGKYKFKIRLFDHKTRFFTVRLRPGRHIKKRIKMVKGDDPIMKKENPDLAPPPAMASLIKKKKQKKKKKKKKKEKDPIILLDDK